MFLGTNYLARAARARRGRWAALARGAVTASVAAPALAILRRHRGGQRTPVAALDEQTPSRDFLALMLTDAMPQMVWSTRSDGHHDYFNPQWYAFTGVPEGSTDGDGWNGMFHPDDQERAWARWRHSLATGEPYEIEYRLRHHAEGYRWTLGRALPVRSLEGRIVRWIGTCTDINDRKIAEQQRELLTLEMSHRIKNLFSIVSAVVAIEARDANSVKELVSAVQGKIVALGATHSLVTSPNTAFAGTLDATLHRMIAKVVEPYQLAGGSRIELSGDDVAVGSEAATAMALIFHELATNAVKYGALSVPEGRVAVVIHSDTERLAVVWRERGGPVAAGPPPHTGFGSLMTETTLRKQLNGSIERDWGEDGLTVTIRMDPARLAGGGG